MKGGGVQLGVYRGRIGAPVDQRDAAAGKTRFLSAIRLCDGSAQCSNWPANGLDGLENAVFWSRRFPGLGLDPQLASRGLACWDPEAERENACFFFRVTVGFFGDGLLRGK